MAITQPQEEPDGTAEPLERARQRVIDALDGLNQAIERLTDEMRRAMTLMPQVEGTAHAKPRLDATPHLQRRTADPP